MKPVSSNRPRWIMHVDMDAFFASVEQLDHPEYRNRPVIVGGLSGRGVVSTASYEARRFGVHSAMPMKEALERSPKGIFVEGRYGRYLELSQKIRQIFHEFSPLVEPLSIDEAFLDLTGMERLVGDIPALGLRIKERIKRKRALQHLLALLPISSSQNSPATSKNPMVLSSSGRARQPHASPSSDFPHLRHWSKVRLPFNALWHQDHRGPCRL